MAQPRIKTNIELYKEIRKTWGFNPKTRVKKSKKGYNRNKSKQEFRKELHEE